MLTTSTPSVTRRRVRGFTSDSVRGRSRSRGSLTSVSDDATSEAGSATPAPLATSDIAPVDVDGVAAIAIGTVAWLVALLVSLLLRERLEQSGDSWWIGVCLAGFLLGLPGLVFLRGRRARHAARVPAS